MPHIDFIGEADYYNRLGSFELHKTKLVNNLKLNDCNLILNNSQRFSNECTTLFYEDFGSNVAPIYSLNLNGFSINNGIQNISGIVGGIGVATWQNETSPVSGNEGFDEIKLSELVDNFNELNCNHCVSQSVGKNIIGDNTALAAFGPEYPPNEIQIIRQLTICLNGDSRLEEISFIKTIDVNWAFYGGFGIPPTQRNPYQKWFSVKIDGSNNIAANENPFKEHTILVNSEYKQYNFSGNNFELRDANLIADIPINVSITLSK